MPHFVTTGASVLQATLFVLAFVWISVALGRRLRGWLGGSTDNDSAEHVTIAIALGAGALQLVPFVLGAARILSVGSLRIAMAVMALLSVVDARAVGSNLRAAFFPPLRRHRWVVAWTLALLPGLLATGLVALAPAIDADGLGYHLTVPKRWLETGSLGYLPTYPNSNMPMGGEMLFTIALVFAGDAAAKVLHFAFGVAGAAGLYCAGVRLSGKVVGAAAAALYLFGPFGVGTLLGCAYVEGVTSFAVIAAVLAWISWFQTRDVSSLRVACVLAGLGASFKITAGVVPVALLALTVAARIYDARQRTAYTAPQARWLALLVLCVLPVAPWLARSAVVTGNPFFPMWARYIPSRDFSPHLADEWEHFNRYLNWGSGIGARWTLDQRQLLLAGGAAAAVAAASVACLLLRSWMARATTVVVLGVVLAQLLSVGFYVRYWVPIASVLQLPLLALCGRTMAGRWQRVALVAATMVASLAQARRSFRAIDDDVAGAARTALGIEDQRTFLRRHLGLFPLYERVNRELPGESRVLLTNYCGGFHIDRTTFCGDIVQGSLRMATWDDFVDDLRRLHVTHVMAPRTLVSGEMPSLNDTSGVGFMVRKDECSRVGRLLADHGHLLASASDQGLYEIELDRVAR